MITGRELRRDEVDRLWTIDRREVIEKIYHCERGALVLTPEHIEVSGWPSGEAESFTPILIDCFSERGWLYGLFEDVNLIGAAVLGGKLIGREKRTIQLKFLHVSKSYRRLGYGKRLFAMAKIEAIARGANRLYISATPSENTVNFYLRLGCVVARDVIPELFALEPKDIHLVSLLN